MKIQTVTQTKITVEESTRNFAKLEFDTILVSHKLNVGLLGDVPFTIERSIWLEKDEAILKLRGQFVAKLRGVLNEQIAVFK